MAELISRGSPAGSHRSGSSSVSALVSTLIPAVLFSLVFITAFLILRPSQRRVYAARTYLPVLRKDERTPLPIAKGRLGWITDFSHLPDEYVLVHQSLDQYLFLRFLKMITIMCFVGCCITWPVLFPINANGGGGQSGLDILSFSNVQNPTRYFAHAFVAWAFLGFVMIMVARETVYFIHLRQAYLLAPQNASRISARTVLFTDVPRISLPRLRRMFRGVERIWTANDCHDLQELIKERDKLVDQLETAEVQLSKAATKNGMKIKGVGLENGSNPEQWIDRKLRPTHRLKTIIGKKVDTIEWTTQELLKILPKIQREQSDRRGKDGAKFIGAVFIQFRTQRDAQTAFQLTPHESPLKMTPRCIGVPPSQVGWKNLKLNGYKRVVREYIALGTMALLIMFWSIPVAFVGVLTNVNYLTNKVPFLSFINDIPPVILGVVTGLLPTLLLALLVIMVPILCRKLAKYAGAVSMQEVEMKTQEWYFGFQVIQVFLVTTFSSGATSVVTAIISDPTSAPMLLAKDLPKASNFYISYFILHGLVVSSKVLFNAATLLKFNVVARFTDKTPRKMFNSYVSLYGLHWGKEYPKWTNMAVIAISYSCIAPLILGFATVGLGFIYFAYRYMSFFSVSTMVDTKGQAYARALQQLTTGVYLATLCLIGLFGINIGTSATSLGPMILMIFFLAIAVLFHITMRKILHPLTITLPASLLEETDGINLQEGLEDGLNDGSNTYSRSSHTDHLLKDEEHKPRRPQEPERSGSFIARFFRPNKYASYDVLTELLRLDDAIPQYPQEILENAYFDPAITNPPPTIWLARDKIGISTRECRVLEKDVSATDEHAWFDEQGHVAWDVENVRNNPLWREEMAMVI